MSDADRFTEHLTQIEQRLRSRGLPPLSQATVQTLVEVMTAHGLDSQPMDYDLIAEQVMEALKAAGEGGLINDSSGQATAVLRQQQGVLSPQQPRTGVLAQQHQTGLVAPQQPGLLAPQQRQQ